MKNILSVGALPLACAMLSVTGCASKPVRQRAIDLPAHADSGDIVVWNKTPYTIKVTADQPIDRRFIEQIRVTPWEVNPKSIAVFTLGSPTTVVASITFTAMRRHIEGDVVYEAAISHCKRLVSVGPGIPSAILTLHTLDF